MISPIFLLDAIFIIILILEILLIYYSERRFAEQLKTILASYGFAYPDVVDFHFIRKHILDYLENILSSWIAVTLLTKRFPKIKRQEIPAGKKSVSKKNVEVFRDVVTIDGKSYVIEYEV